MAGVGTDTGLRAEQVSGQISGPLVRDKVWMVGSYQLDDTYHDGRRFSGHSAMAKLTTQPTTEHRLTGTVNVGTAGVEEGLDPVPQGTSLGIAQWQWFLAPEVKPRHHRLDPAHRHRR